MVKFILPYVNLSNEIWKTSRITGWRVHPTRPAPTCGARPRRVTTKADRWYAAPCFAFAPAPFVWSLRALVFASIAARRCCLYFLFIVLWPGSPYRHSSWSSSGVAPSLSWWIFRFGLGFRVCILGFVARIVALYWFHKGSVSMWHVFLYFFFRGVSAEYCCGSDDVWLLLGADFWWNWTMRPYR